MPWVFPEQVHPAIQVPSHDANGLPRQDNGFRERTVVVGAIHEQCEAVSLRNPPAIPSRDKYVGHAAFY